MKLFKTTALATVLVLGSIGAASAVTLDNLPGVTGPNINVKIDNGVATLFGQADSGSDKQIAERYVANIEGVNKVINLVTHQ